MAGSSSGWVGATFLTRSLISGWRTDRRTPTCESGGCARSPTSITRLAGRDRVEYLLDLIGPARTIDFAKEGMKGGPPPDPRFPFETGRLRNVIELAAAKSN